jgi:hypothetical protein
MDLIHILPPDASTLEKVLFAKGQRNALADMTLDSMREYSDGIFDRHGFTHYDAYWTGVDSILDHPCNTPNKAAK